MRDKILPGIGGNHEFLRLASTHGARIGFDHHVLETATIEDAAVRVVMLLI